MSYAEQGKSHSERQGQEPLAGLSGVADEIKQLLATLAGEIEDSKRVQRQALDQIEARLTRIESEAPTDAGMAFSAGRRSIGAAPAAGAPEPWDLDTAEALTKSYEAQDPGFVAARPYRASHAAPAQAKPNHRPPQGPPQAQAAPAGTDLERAWLGHRITDFTQRIKRSLAEMRPQSSLAALEERIDQFQQRIALALEDVARRSDVDGLRRIEAQVGELGNRLGHVQSQLSRFDGIENHLSTVLERLSDERLGELAAQYARGATDLETVARFAAEETHVRLAEAVGDRDHNDARFEELRAAIEDSISERRMGERQAMTMLDTMQEALIQVLDRIEAIEHATRAASPAAAKTRGLYDPASELAHDKAPKVAPPAVSGLSIDPRDLRDVEVENGYWSELSSDVLSTGAQPPAVPLQSSSRPADPFSSADGLDGEKAEGLSAIDKLRLDLIADAQRAKLKAAASRAEQSSLKVAARRPQIGSRLSSWVATQAASGAGRLFGAAPRLIVSALFIAAAVGGALLMNLLHEREAKLAQATAAAPALLGASREQRAAPKVAQEEPRVPEAVIQGLGFETGDDWPRNGAMPVPQSALIEEAPAPAGKSTSGRGGDATSSLSDKLGAVAAKANLASLFDEQGASIAQDTTPSTDDDTSKASALHLPPVSVGPLALRLAAANGDASAEFEVGVRLAEGRGTPQDLEGAVRWYRRSAARGFAQAQYRLATHLERGFGVGKDVGRARIWYQRAAEKGNVKAMHNLAVLSASSEPTSPDYAAAGKWFTAAAECGLSDSQYNLAVLYENGLGVARSLVLAYKWYSLAAKGGDKDAIARRDAMKGELSAKDLAAAEELVGSFSPKAVDPVVNDARAGGEDWKRRETLDANG